MKKISVVIVDDHPVVLHGVSSLLHKQKDMQLAGVSNSADTALPLIKKEQPDVVILDISLAGISGIDLIPHIKSLSSNTAIVIYSTHQSHDHIYRALQAGALGYVLKSDQINALITAVQEARQGRNFLSPMLPESILDTLASKKTDRGPLSSLSKREYEIANLIAQGMRPDEIGELLFISPKTVRVHRTNIMHKLNCKRANELLLLLGDCFPQ